jgi:hypothetical protein
VSATLLICLPFHKAACILPACLYPPAVPTLPTVHLLAAPETTAL